MRHRSAEQFFGKLDYLTLGPPMYRTRLAGLYLHHYPITAFHRAQAVRNHQNSFTSW